MRLFIVICIATSLSACSARDVYEFGHSIGESKADCEALTSQDERAQCAAQFERDFETYQRERDALRDTEDGI